MTKERIILGIDPGTNILGFGVISIDAKGPHYVTMGVFDLRKISDPFEKLANINAGVKELIGQMADTLPIAFISSVDDEGYPCSKAMLSPRVREGIKVFYFTTNTFSLRVAHYKANPKASIYFCDTDGFKGMMLRGTMEVLMDAASKEMIWRDGDEQYYPGGVTDPNYCVLKFTASDGRFYSDYYPRSFVIE